MSPFAFFRGAAVIMASDLSQTPRSGFEAQLCGDAHLANFGMFGTPERGLVFDVNDFDETLPGPWEWDVKRLATSFEIAGRESSFPKSDRHAFVTTCVRTYREAMRAFAEMATHEVWYARRDVDSLLGEHDDVLGHRELKRGSRSIESARRRDSAHAFEKLTHVVDGQRRLVHVPPLIAPLRELVPPNEVERVELAVRKLLTGYRTSLADDRRWLFDQFRLVEVARKVVGIGSVGTRCWIALLLGIDDDPVFLQIKEAEASVLEPFCGASVFPNHGQRVVAGQRLVQAASDLWLGWTRTDGIDGVARDYYVRQLHDWKGTFFRERGSFSGTLVYARICGWSLARAHARSGDRIAISAYLGKNDTFDEAIAAFARSYADQNDRDYERFARAARRGRVAMSPDA